MGPKLEQTAMVAAKHYTATEYVEMGSESDRFELVKGELREVAAAGAWHGEIGAKLIALLWTVARRERLGKIYNSETGVIVSREPDSLLMPDVSFIRTERLPANRKSEDFVPFSPDLAVEIESPSNRAGEMIEKVALYIAGGTRLVWLIHPRHRTVTVFRPGEPELVLTVGDTLDGVDVVPGFSLALAELFSPDF